MLSQRDIVRNLLRAMEELLAAASQMVEEEEGRERTGLPTRNGLPPDQADRQARLQARGRQTGNGQAHKKVPNDIREAIVAAVAVETLTGKELANRLDRSPRSGTFRDYLATLQADGTLIKTDGGFVLGDDDP